MFCCLALFDVQRRIAEGAAMLRTKGEAGTGNVVEAVRHARSVQKEIKMVRMATIAACAAVATEIEGQTPDSTGLRMH